MVNMVSKATLGRLPGYLRYIRTLGTVNVSSAAIAKALDLGEVQVRKDLAAVGGNGRPKVGYRADDLVVRLEDVLGQQRREPVILAGAGKLGRALLDYNGFEDYGLEIRAAFDKIPSEESSVSGKPIYPIGEMKDYCLKNGIRIGILTVPSESAQEVCDMMIESCISAIWSFAPVSLKVPEGVALTRENMALSLAHLFSQIK